MNTIDSYLSQENKKTLWSVLYEQGAFSNFGDNDFESIHNYFETSLKNSAQNITPQDNLLNVNKSFIRNMMQNLSSMKNKSHVADKQRVTSNEISGQRQEELNERLKIHEDNLKMMINPKKPGEISFTDENEDTPIGDDMDSLLAEKIAQRNLDIDVTNTANNTIESHSWLDGKSADSSELENNNINQEKKKVTFEDDNLLNDTVVTDSASKLTDNLFSKLKTKPTLEIEEVSKTDDSEIKQKLDTILSRLDTIEKAINSLVISK